MVGNLFLKKVKKILQPAQNIAGLEIKDTAIRIAKLEDGVLKKSAFILEPGIIEDGQIKDSRRLVLALKKLHSEFFNTQERIPVILIVPSAAVYTQVFSAPLVSGASLEEAAKLNLESVSPLDLNNAYADWQKIGVREKDGKLDMLGAFIERPVSDAYFQVLKTAGFLAAAVEFPSLGIVRVIKEFGVGVNPENPQVVLNVASDGLNFMVIKNSNLYFDYFVPWKLIKEEGKAETKILPSDFKDTIIKEIKRVSTFYTSHWGGKLDNLILVTQALNMEVAQVIKENFQLGVTDLKLRNFGDLPSAWFSVLGAALRGNLPRSEDNLISLMAIGTEKLYLQTEIIFFAKIWRNVFIITLGFSIILLIFVDSFLNYSESRLEKQLNETLNLPGGAEAIALQEQVKNFNKLTEKALAAKKESFPWSRFFSKISSIVKGGVSLVRILVNQDNSALIVGSAPSESSAIDFKNSLAKQGFENVVLPLSEISTGKDGRVLFTITFKL